MFATIGGSVYRLVNLHELMDEILQLEPNSLMDFTTLYIGKGEYKEGEFLQAKRMTMFNNDITFIGYFSGGDIRYICNDLTDENEAREKLNEILSTEFCSDFNIVGIFDKTEAIPLRRAK